MADAPNVAYMKIFVYILVSCHVVPFALCVCEHGTYDHKEIKCCHCGPGQDIKDHCTENGTSGKCVPCQSGKFKSHPSISACRQCKSCEHENANLEEDTPCKPAADRKCRCKEGFYCPSTTIACTVCLPCQECDDGVKVACTQHNDTICNPKTEWAGIIAAAVIGVLVIFAVIAGVLWRKYRGKRNEDYEQPKEIPDDIDHQHHVPALAEVIGWKCMCTVARSGGVTKIAIDNCKESHKGDVNQQTIELLDIYMEKHGRGWESKLRDGLLQHGNKRKAQQVENILLNEDGNNLPA